eukprot:4757749-Pyramimonas_sp.AAC.2
MSANVKGGCRGPDLREASKTHSWSDSGHAHYKKGVHTQIHFVFWSFNDIADPGTYNLLGIRVEGKSGAPARPENPTMLAGALRPMLETADRIIDDAVKRSHDGTIEILYIGGDHRCWQTPEGSFKVDPLWDDVATLVRALRNRRIEDYKAAVVEPRIMILDGACLYRQMHHPNGDSHHFLSAHNVT